MANQKWENVFETDWFSIEASKCENLSSAPYYRLSCDDSVEILAVTGNGELILVRQFRPAVGMSLFELPAGHVDPGESAEDAVRRELKEETGYICQTLTYLGHFKIAPSRINNTLHLFFGERATRSDVILEKSEPAVRLVSQGEFKKLIQNGGFMEMAGIATYSLAKLSNLL